ncbi:MAG: autotransporter assembly complex protein TamA [bacterium]
MQITTRRFHYCCHLIIEAFWVISLLGPGQVFANNGLSYRVKIEGAPDRKIHKLLEGISNTASHKQIPVISTNLLRKKAERDIPRFLQALKSQGYYKAKVSVKIHADIKPVLLIFQIDQGPPFVLKTVNVHILGENTSIPIKLPRPNGIGLILGDRAISKAIIEAEKMLIHSVKSQGYPFPKITDRKVVVDHAGNSVDVGFFLTPGPEASFGKTNFAGLQSVEESFPRSRIPWKEGSLFNGDLLSELQNRLIATGLFTSVTVKGGNALDAEGRLPITVRVKERKHRTVKAGMSYKTDEGVGGKLSWEHRNFFRKGERVNTNFTISEIASTTEAGFRKPGFFHPNQSLILNASLAEERPEAFKSRNLNSSLILERSLTMKMKLGTGLAYRGSQVDQLGQREGFTLLSLPVYLNWDTSNDLLDPDRGRRMIFQIIPFYDIYGSELGFVKGYAGYSQYVKLTKSPFMILAGRTTFGSIWGAGRDSIPADIRFYAGGGGSIRGYAFQSVGPLLIDEPIGGRSIFEISAELRIKATDTIGFVAFLDGGSAFESDIPDFNEAIRWGTGLGFRYFTPVGPLRMDIGFPLNRRIGLDKKFQIYISLGQSF